jgi:hypothetical protein
MRKGLDLLEPDKLRLWMISGQRGRKDEAQKSGEEHIKYARGIRYRTRSDICCGDMRCGLVPPAVHVTGQIFSPAQPSH